MAVRTLDFTKFHSGSEAERRAFGQALLDGFRTTGFVKLINHGFSREEMADIFNWNQRFFDLPNDWKAAIRNDEGPKPQRGWSSVGAEKTGFLNPGGKLSLAKGAENDRQDAKEHFDIGPAGDEEFRNKWPEPHTIPGFQETMNAYFDRSQAITLELLEALALAMDVPQDTFVRLCHGHASELRLNHYPSIPVQTIEAGKTSRIWPHTDFGIITLLAQDDAGGLEIQDREHPAQFLPVNRENPTEFVVNIGDILERWTNGRLCAGLHQVTTPRGVKDGGRGGTLPARRSVAFFLKPHRGMSVAPISYFVPGDQAPRYEDMTALAYQKLRTGIVY
ncbi:isopenicillin N synthase family dioxygenase [Aspergillus mulundensis]|uniref:Non-heme iron a-ketoglutarate dependent dioxygenase n=1 Tax=Aspergillus mulundensis TaxID=1810919 RepID=A0A3D8SBQ2_9EURO|nr:Non-heme iron a-ketoglutarate dependent dioxygenase [Aspergillus mulundensis]RDW83779.1 Non-heme iron a-ketoglutarate dependent dioxygenase [Aspergillus mulundensis]